MKVTDSESDEGDCEGVDTVDSEQDDVQENWKFKRPWGLYCGRCCCCCFCCSVVFLAGFLGTCAALGLVSDQLGHSLLVPALTEYLGTNSSVAAVRIGAWSKSLQIKGLNIGSPPGYKAGFLMIDGIELTLNMDYWSLLSTASDAAASEPVFLRASRLEIHGLSVNFEQRTNGSSNLQEIVDHALQVINATAEDGHDPEATEEPFKVIIDRLYVTDTSLRVNSTHFLLETLKEPLSLRIPSLLKLDVGKEQSGITIDELWQILLQDALREVVPAGDSLDMLGKAALVSGARHYLGTEASVRAASIDVASMNAWIGGVTIGGPPGYSGDFVSVEGLVVDFALDRDSTIALVQNASASQPLLVRLHALTLQGLRVLIEQRSDGATNVQEIIDHVSSELHSPEANATEEVAVVANRSNASQESAPVRLIIDRLYISDVRAKADMKVVGESSFRIVHSVLLKDVGNETDGITVGELWELLLSEILNDVAQHAPQVIKEPLSKVSKWTKLAVEGVNTLEEAISLMPTLAPPYIPEDYEACGSSICKKGLPCCGNGICGVADGFCCGRWACLGGSVCCNGFCLASGTTCLLNNSLSHYLGIASKAVDTLAALASCDLGLPVLTWGGVPRRCAAWVPERSSQLGMCSTHDFASHPAACVQLVPLSQVAGHQFALPKWEANH
eukprot:CAMPEP_0179065038 /NCGR_PEP_ID=MMETSP0796-20121207/28252_1 /TAXON_ID=73915 /ORGANISM="Pyrodinium bahamense, Strain pbaha01" /LENGTH=673 /DNA_ID=CAMNT_0020761993 /DNA_START=42 /DNA_END=2064 /DNA_ORIENTATION=+